MPMPPRRVGTKNRAPSPHDPHWRDDDWLPVDGDEVLAMRRPDDLPRGVMILDATT